MRITYFDGRPGVQLQEFLVSSKAGHLLEEDEVYQLNNIFGDSAIPADVHTRDQVEARAAHKLFSGYIVQLDNTTQDGSFFLLFEE